MPYDPKLEAGKIIEERIQRFKAVHLEFWVSEAAIEATNELTRIRLELTAIRELLDHLVTRPPA
jgi:hypothetical protein